MMNDPRVLPTITTQKVQQLMQELAVISEEQERLSLRLDHVRRQLLPMLTPSGSFRIDPEEMIGTYRKPALYDSSNRAHITQAVHPHTTPIQKKRSRKGVWRRRIAVFCLETCYLSVAAVLAYGIWVYLAPWPVYRIVAAIILVILWSNFASTAARHTTTRQQATEIVHAVKFATMKHKALSPKEVIKADTTSYFAAIKENMQERRSIY